MRSRSYLSRAMFTALLLLSVSVVAHGQHRFLCVSSCLFYVYSDAAFDIHYVDESGKEMSSEDAKVRR